MHERAPVQNPTVVDHELPMGTRVKMSETTKCQSQKIQTDVKGTPLLAAASSHASSLTLDEVQEQLVRSSKEPELQRRELKRIKMSHMFSIWGFANINRYSSSEDWLVREQQ